MELDRLFRLPFHFFDVFGIKFCRLGIIGGFFFCIDHFLQRTFIHGIYDNGGQIDRAARRLIGEYKLLIHFRRRRIGRNRGKNKALNATTTEIILLRFIIAPIKERSVFYNTDLLFSINPSF